MAEEKEKFNYLFGYGIAGGIVLATIFLVALISLGATGTALGGLMVLFGFPISIAGLNALFLKKRQWKGRIILAIGTILLVLGLDFMIRGSFRGTLIALPVMTGVVLAVGYFVLAPFNVYFTIIEEKQAKNVMRAGKFWKCIMQWEGYWFDEEWNVVPLRKPLNWFHRFLLGNLFGGFWFYGFWPIDAIWTYDFEFKGVEADGVTPKSYSLKGIDYVPLAPGIYFEEVIDAEDKDRTPITVRLLLTIRVFNPYRAIFRVLGPWIKIVLGRTVPAVRVRVGTELYEEIIPKEVDREIYAFLNTPPTGAFYEFRTQYGIDVQALQFPEIIPHPDVKEATLLEFKAKQERKRILITADAKRQELKILARGEAARFTTIANAIIRKGDLGITIRALEVLEKAPQQGAKEFFFLPTAVTDLLSRAFGKPLSEIKPEEAKAVKEILEKEGKK